MFVENLCFVVVAIGLAIIISLLKYIGALIFYKDWYPEFLNNRGNCG